MREIEELLHSAEETKEFVLTVLYKKERMQQALFERTMDWAKVVDELKALHKKLADTEKALNVTEEVLQKSLDRETELVKQMERYEEERVNNGNTVQAVGGNGKSTASYYRRRRNR